MAYVIGTANSFADVLSALRTACVDAGWTLSGSILSKGGAVIDTGSTATSVWVRGGTGIGAGNSLTGPGGRTVYARSPKTGVDVPFPVTYHLHVLSGPDEVYLIINFSLTYFIFIAFGCSPVAGLPGTGCWYTGSTSEDTSCNDIRVGTGGMVGGNFQYASQCVPAPFWAWSSAASNGRGGNNSFVHHGLDGGGWSVALDDLGDPLIVANAQHAARPLIERLPNTWNGETVLLPITPGVYRASAKVSIVAEFQHARYLRNDGLIDGQILTLGPDMWKTYPFWLRSTVNRNGDNDSSGTFGWAVRYDGTPP